MTLISKFLHAWRQSIGFRRNNVNIAVVVEWLYFRCAAAVSWSCALRGVLLCGVDFSSSRLAAASHCYATEIPKFYLSSVSLIYA